MEKVFESEIKLLELLWEGEPISAKSLSVIANEKLGWNKNTTYTILAKLEKKKYIRREDPGYICISLVSREEVCKSETNNLINKLFHGSKKALFSAMIEDESLTEEDIEELRKMIEKR